MKITTINLHTMGEEIRNKIEGSAVDQFRQAFIDNDYPHLTGQIIQGHCSDVEGRMEVSDVVYDINDLHQSDWDTLEEDFVDKLNAKVGEEQIRILDFDSNFDLYYIANDKEEITHIGYLFQFLMDGDEEITDEVEEKKETKADKKPPKKKGDKK